MKKAVIFDFGNVIAWFDFGRVVRNFADLGEGLSDEVVREKLFAGNLLDRFEVGGISADGFLEEVRQRLGLGDVSERQIVDAWCDLFTPNEKVTSVIKQIPADVALVLGSTTNALHFEFYRREYADVLDRFKGLVTSFEVKALKPDPVFYERCLVEAECESSECLYFDDIPEYVEAAANLGIEGVVYDESVDLAVRLQEVDIMLQGGERT